MGNAIVLALLRSPLGRLLGGLCELEFTGRRSGRAVRLPVQYARDRDRTGEDDDGHEQHRRDRMKGRAVAGAGVMGGAAAAYIGALRPWQLRWGATGEEVGATLAGDDLITNPDLMATRAITVDAGADQVWPWIAQLGQGRGGFYSYDRLETWLAATSTVRTGSSPNGRTSRSATRSSSTPTLGWR